MYISAHFMSYHRRRCLWVFILQNQLFQKQHDENYWLAFENITNMKLSHEDERQIKENWLIRKTKGYLSLQFLNKSLNTNKRINTI